MAILFLSFAVCVLAVSVIILGVRVRKLEDVVFPPFE